MCFPCNNEEFFAWEKKKKGTGGNCLKNIKKKSQLLGGGK